MQVCSVCSLSLNEWCYLVPCRHVLCLHCTVELHACGRGACNFRCTVCSTRVASLHKRKIFATNHSSHEVQDFSFSVAPGVSLLRPPPKERNRAPPVVRPAVAENLARPRLPTRNLPESGRVPLQQVSFNFNFERQTPPEEKSAPLQPVALIKKARLNKKNLKHPTIVRPTRKTPERKKPLPKSVELPEDRELDLQLRKTFVVPGGIARMINSSEIYDSSTCTKFGEKDESDNWDDFPVAPPPPPCEKYHNLYGIQYNHGSFAHALRAAKDGDKVYIPKGVYHSDADDFLEIKSSIEIIGMGENPEDTVIYRNDRIDICAVRPVRISNLTFRHGTEFSNWYMSASTDDPILALSGNPIAENKTDLVVDNCIIDMGTDEVYQKESERARGCVHCPIVTRSPGLVSGIMIQAAHSVSIHSCDFKGGSGSAIVMTNDPDLFLPQVQVLACTFTYGGQRGSGNHFEASREFCPAPGVIELWYIRRHREQVPRKKFPIRLTDNTFNSNGNAPLIYRALFREDVGKKLGVRPKIDLVHAPSHPGHPKQIYTEAYDVFLHRNTYDSNGFRVDCAQFEKSKERETAFSGNEATLLKVEGELYPSCCDDSEGTRWEFIFEPRDKPAIKGMRAIGVFLSTQRKAQLAM